MPSSFRPAIGRSRGFSAPVSLKTDAPPRDAYVLLASDGDLFNRWEAGQKLAAKQLHRLEGERDGLTVEVATESPRRSDLTGTERAELALIEDRLVDLRRRAVAAERSQPSKLIVESLGPRPKDPLNASLWNNGVDAIFSYRQRYGITSTGKDPLGGKARDGAQRRDRREAELRLARAQKQLGKQRVRSAERAMRIGR